jgi:dTDP-4-amino-4,6-dideoxygalactose transaminase
LTRPDKAYLNTKNSVATDKASQQADKPLHVGRPNIVNQDRFLALAEQVVSSGWLTNRGPLVQKLEQQLSEYLGVKHCITTCNGTLALEIAIRALNIKGEVIVPSFTFIASAHALRWQGVTPVFVDIDPKTHNLCPESVEAAITDKTSAILGVHLWGRPAPVTQLQAIADKHNIKVLFDAAHAFGCSYQGAMIGGNGEAEVFSFHATKFFNTFEGGAICTQSDELAQKIRLMQNFGFEGYDHVIYPGTNGKMTEICAAMGLSNFEKLNHIKAINKRNYNAYQKALSNITGLTLINYDQAQDGNHQYIVVELEDSFPLTRDDLVTRLHKQGVLARKYFWPGCHRMEAYQGRPQPHLPHTDFISERVVVLPTGCAVSLNDIKRVCELLAAMR